MCFVMLCIVPHSKLFCTFLYMYYWLTYILLSFPLLLVSKALSFCTLLYLVGLLSVIFFNVHYLMIYVQCLLGEQYRMVDNNILKVIQIRFSDESSSHMWMLSRVNVLTC